MPSTTVDPTVACSCNATVMQQRAVLMQQYAVGTVFQVGKLLYSQYRCVSWTLTQAETHTRECVCVGGGGVFAPPRNLSSLMSINIA